MSVEPVAFDLHGDQLVGVLTRPDSTASVGVVVVVGGPQYRVGSHRQFQQLSVALAGAGIASLRFDVRGMGDSEGSARDFLSLEDDIGAAVAAMHGRCPQLQRLVLWGLCDGATAICDFAAAHKSVDAVVMLNPWVTSAAGQQQVEVQHYRAQWRSSEFWRRLFTGKVNILAAAGGAAAVMVRRMQPGSRQSAETLPQLFARNLRNLACDLLVVTSGQDFTAQEFLASREILQALDDLEASGDATRVHLEAADHTFSNGPDQEAMFAATIRFLSFPDQRAIL